MTPDETQELLNARKILAEQIRSYRKKIGLTGDKLGEKLGGYDKSTVARWEDPEDDLIPNAQALFLLHKAFNISIDELFGIPPRTIEVQPAPPKPSVRVFNNQGEADNEIVQFIRDHHPREAFFIQYSSDYVTTILDALATSPVTNACSIYLLLKHPGQVGSLRNPNYDRIAASQRTKILSRLDKLLNMEHMRDNPHVQIKCYWLPGAMRASYLGSPVSEQMKGFNISAMPDTSNDSAGLLSLSMYRYANEAAGVRGMENPLIHTYSNTDEGKILCGLFETQFVELWNNSVPGVEVLDAYQHPVRRWWSSLWHTLKL